MPEVKKQIVYIRGWASMDYSYKQFRKSIPDECEVHMISAAELMPNLNLAESKEIFKRFIEDKKLDKFILVGHSLGGALAIYLGNYFGQNIQRLVLINSTGIKNEIKFLAATKTLLLQKLKSYKIRVVDKIVEGVNLLRKPFYQVRLGLLAQNLDLEKYCSQLNLPVLILWGDKDALVSLERGRKMQKIIPGSKMAVLEGLDHDWVLYEPEKFWERIHVD